MLKIWGRLTSINVRKVVLAAQELAIPFTRVDAGGPFGIVRTPDYVAKNPNSLIPVIEDDQMTLWESNVIVRYLCARHSPDKLYPLALVQRFEAERWMDWQQTSLNPAGRHAFIQWVRTPADRRDQQLIDQSVAATEPRMDVLEHHLARQTMADLPIACEVDRWYSLPKSRPERRHLDRWFAGMLARPSGKGVLGLPAA
jgi:glutathione S-transferase